MIARLTAASDCDLSTIGGKGCGLVRLMRAGLNVPDTWCVPAISSDMVNKDADSKLDLSSRALWNELLAADPGIRLAVRSSATAEDLDVATSAGIYQTILDVAGPDQLVNAVVQVRKTLHSAAAQAYRAQRGLGQDHGIAVLIQKQVAADAAGVLLTANPHRPFAGELVIEAVRGLGESLVSGRAQPDHIVMDRSTGSVRSYDAGQGETTRCLTMDQLSNLFQTARSIGEGIGAGRDIEWAFQGETLHLLQDTAARGLS